MPGIDAARWKLLSPYLDEVLAKELVVFGHEDHARSFLQALLDAGLERASFGACIATTRCSTIEHATATSRWLGHIARVGVSTH